MNKETAMRDDFDEFLSMATRNNKQHNNRNGEIFN